MVKQTTLLPKPVEKIWEFRIDGEPMQYRTPDTRIITDKQGKIVPKKDPFTGKIIKPFILIQHPDKRVTAWEDEIRKQVRFALRQEFDPILWGGPVRMELWVFLTRPKSVTTMYPDKQPDRTNYIKSSEDGLEQGLQHDVACDAKGNVTRREGFNDGQVVSGPVEKRWAWMNYPDCGRNAPGILVRLQRMDTSLEKALNADYKAFLKREGMEYVTEEYGRGKKDPETGQLIKKKRTVLRKVV